MPGTSRPDVRPPAWLSGNVCITPAPTVACPTGVTANALTACICPASDYSSVSNECSVPNPLLALRGVLRRVTAACCPLPAVRRWSMAYHRTRDRQLRLHLTNSIRCRPCVVSHSGTCPAGQYDDAPAVRCLPAPTACARPVELWDDGTCATQAIALSPPVRRHDYHARRRCAPAPAALRPVIVHDRMHWATLKHRQATTPLRPTSRAIPFSTAPWYG